MSADPEPLDLDEARRILAEAGVELPACEVARFAQTAAVMRALAAVLPAPQMMDEPAVIFDPLQAMRA